MTGVPELERLLGKRALRGSGRGYLCCECLATCRQDQRACQCSESESLIANHAVSLTVAGLKSRRWFPCRLSQACLFRQGFPPASLCPGSLVQPRLCLLRAPGPPSFSLVVPCTDTCGGSSCCLSQAFVGFSVRKPALASSRNFPKP